MEGHIRQRGKNTWAIVVDLGRDANGRRKQKWYTVHGKRKDAERERTRILHEMNTGTFVEPSKMTVEDYLDRWQKDYAEHHVAKKTLERYAEIIRLHLVPSLGKYKLADLKPMHIQGFYTAALKGGRRDGKGGLSAQTVLHYHRLLHEALEQAVRWQLIARNPADAVEPPRPERQEMVALDEKDTIRLLRAAESDPLHDLVLVAVTTGLRRGELLGLRWQDVDLDRATLSVRQSLEQTKAGLAFKQPKTRKSRRTISLLPMTVDCLRRLRVAQAKERLALGPAYMDNDLVFCRPDGQPLSPSMITKAFAKLVARAGIPKIHLHSLRHSHATQLLKQGVNVKVVSERLGHTSVTITLDIYGHVLPGMQEDAADRLERAFARVLEKREQTDNSVRDGLGEYLIDDLRAHDWRLAAAR